MILVALLILFLQDSNFLTKEEHRLIRKGISFELFTPKVRYTFSYDIWKDAYVIYNNDVNTTFDHPDKCISYIKEMHQLDHLFIREKRKKVEKRSIILFDFVSDMLSEDKRKIVF